MSSDLSSCQAELNQGHGRSSRYTWESMEGGTALFCRGENTKLCWPDIQSRRSRESLYGKTELYHNQLTNRTSTDIGVCNEQTEPDQLGINDQDETSGLLIHAEHKTGIEGSFPKFSLDSENAQSLPIPVTANDQNITPKQRPTGEGSDHNIQGQNNNDQIQNVKISKKKKLEKLDMVSSTLDSSKQDTSVHIDNSTSGEGCEGTITMKTNSPIKEKEEEENMEKDCQTENCFSSSETNTVNIAKSREKIDENGHIKRDENESPKSMATRTWTRNRKNQTDINRRGKQSDIQKNRKDYHRAVLQDSETSDFPVGVENNRNQSTYEEPISNKEHNEMTPFPNQYTKCEEEEESRLKDMHSEKSTLYATTCNSTNTPYTTGSNQSPEIVDNSLQESLFLDNEHASFEITQGVLQENSFIEKMDLNTSVSHPDSVTECGKNDPTTKNTTPFDNSKANKCTNLDTLPSQSLDNISNISDTYIKHEISNTTIPESSNRTWNFNNSENRIDQTRNPAQIWNEDTQVKTEAICTQQDSGMLNERPETYSFFTQLIPMVVNATLTQMNAASAEKVNNDKLKSKENELRGCSDNDRRWTPDQAQQISNMNERIKQLQRRIEEASELRSKIQLHEKEKEKLKMEIKNLKTQIESIKLDENKRRYEIEQRLNEQRLDFENQLRQHKQDLENHLAKQKVDLEREIERKNELLVRKDETIERLQHELEDRERVIESLLRERQQANTSANDC